MAKIQEQRRKDLTLAQVQNEEHRHTLQTHTENKEQMLRRASQVRYMARISRGRTVFQLLKNLVGNQYPEVLRILVPPKILVPLQISP